MTALDGGGAGDGLIPGLAGQPGTVRHRSRDHLGGNP